MGTTCEPYLRETEGQLKTRKKINDEKNRGENQPYGGNFIGARHEVSMGDAPGAVKTDVYCQAPTGIFGY
ncbi:hypothetical protein AGMMS50267_12640 [Spirochaetia bacterium]|nr:hypothetical protein AGMMS50267_12640 [Spirochaetia bacterium]